MKIKTLAAVGAVLALSAVFTQADPMGTAFTYQGKLSSGTNAANGSYDLTFTLYTDASGSNAVAGPITNSPVAVTNGLFTVTLDFGSGVFTGDARWLELAVRTNGSGAFTTLNPRQALSPTPYSLFASNTAALGGQTPSAYAPASGSTAYVAKSGDTMTGGLNLPANGLAAGGNQLVLSGGKVGIGTASPQTQLHITGSGADTTVRSETLSSDKAAILEVSAPGGHGTLLFGGATYLPWGGPGSLNLINATNGPLTFDHYLNGVPIERMRITSTGNVGIGTANPLSALHVVGNIAAGGIIYSPWAGNNVSLVLCGDSSANTQSAALALWGRSHASWPGEVHAIARNGPIRFWNYNGTNWTENAHITPAGNVGIGTPSPQAKLDVQGNILIPNSSDIRTKTAGGTIRQLLFADSANYLNLGDTASGWSGIKLFPGSGSNPAMTLLSNGRVGIGTNNPSTALDVVGTVAASIVQIKGGLDVAEPFNISTREISKGAVVVIDDENPGLLKMSERSYDKRVAGVVSGANGINPGLTLRQQGVSEGGENVALSGRVYALADASSGRIKPGDLLTTSDTPGHCMRVGDHAKAQGAIIGKAMSALSEGKGMVLVLVSLQ